MSGKIKVGVIGVGALGRHHARLYLENPDVEQSLEKITNTVFSKIGKQLENLKVFLSLEITSFFSLILYSLNILSLSLSLS